MKPSIIIDKCVLQGTNTQILSALTNSQTVILPCALFEECLTTQKSPGPIHLLKKAETIIKAGAFISFSRRIMFEIEKNALQALESIIDEETTEQMRSCRIEDLQISFQEEAEKCNESFKPIIRFVKEAALKFWKNLSKKDCSEDWRKSDEDIDPYVRFTKFTEAFGEDMMKAYFERLYPSISPYVQNNWFIWHLLHLYLIYGLNWAYKRNMSDPSFENFDITNDVYDIDYVLCLSQSNALISYDNKLTIPLARAVFPQKNVYSKLEDLQ